MPHGAFISLLSYMDFIYAYYIIIYFMIYISCFDGEKEYLYFYILFYYIYIQIS